MSLRRKWAKRNLSANSGSHQPTPPVGDGAALGRGGMNAPVAEGARCIFVTRNVPRYVRWSWIGLTPESELMRVAGLSDVKVAHEIVGYVGVN